MLPWRHLMAVAVVTDVALLARGRPVSARALAERQGRPPRHLEALLQSLVRQGLLKGTRGPRGGYELARERRRITVGEIVRVVQRDEDRPPPSRKSSGLLERVILPVLAAPSATFLAELDGINVEQLCRAADSGAKADPASAEFHI
jgi:Rrf2 family transcriptional regulator, iron-sulfur cluster assembly transcription factor